MLGFTCFGFTCLAWLMLLLSWEYDTYCICACNWMWVPALCASAMMSMQSGKRTCNAAFYSLIFAYFSTLFSGSLVWKFGASSFGVFSSPPFPLTHQVCISAVIIPEVIWTHALVPITTQYMRSPTVAVRQPLCIVYIYVVFLIDAATVSTTSSSYTYTSYTYTSYTPIPHTNTSYTYASRTPIPRILILILYSKDRYVGDVRPVCSSPVFSPDGSVGGNDPSIYAFYTSSGKVTRLYIMLLLPSVSVGNSRRHFFW